MWITALQEAIGLITSSFWISQLLSVAAAQVWGPEEIGSASVNGECYSLVCYSITLCICIVVNRSYLHRLYPHESRVHHFELVFTNLLDKVDPFGMRMRLVEALQSDKEDRIKHCFHDHLGFSVALRISGKIQQHSCPHM
jgi:hypothetical protein